MKEYCVSYYLEATVSFKQYVEANSEEEAKEIVCNSDYGDPEFETDWETNKFIITDVELEFDDEEEE